MSKNQELRPGSYKITVNDYFATPSVRVKELAHCRIPWMGNVYKLAKPTAMVGEGE